MFLWGDAYLAQRREPLSWVVQDLIPTGGKANLFGRPKAGKSFLALQMASAVSQGLPHFLGFPILKHGPVAYIQIDTSASVWFERVKDQAALGLSFEKVAFADTDTGTPFPLNILTDAPTIKQQLATIKPVLVFWDTIRETHAGDENDSSVMKNVVSQLLDATRGEGWAAANCFLSHRKKENPNYEEDLMNANRGSSYLAGACDSVMQLSAKFDARSKVITSGTLEFQGRTHGYKRLGLTFGEESCLWEVDAEEAKLLNTIADAVSMNISDRKRAEFIAERLDITIESARGHLKRKKAQFEGRLGARV
jgi:RecA-family ATPase